MHLSEQGETMRTLIAESEPPNAHSAISEGASAA